MFEIFQNFTWRVLLTNFLKNVDGFFRLFSAKEIMREIIKISTSDFLFVAQFSSIEQSLLHSLWRWMKTAHKGHFTQVCFRHLHCVPKGKQIGMLFPLFRHKKTLSYTKYLWLCVFCHYGYKANLSVKLRIFAIITHLITPIVKIL